MYGALQNNLIDQRHIRTFVFFDVETTGLIERSRTTMPRITEMSLVAIARDDLLMSTLPRVMHKLSIPFQPCAAVPLIVTQITGLSNNLLADAKPFDNQVYQLLNMFISRLRPPVCFIAHNGSQFDFPILLSELSRLGKSLPEDVLCVDSLAAFRALADRNQRPPNFKLQTLYEHLVGVVSTDAHSAEGDCLTLLTCAMKIGDAFSRWVDSNAQSLMKLPKKKK